MKKLLLIALCFILAFSLFACGKDTTDNEPSIVTYYNGESAIELTADTVSKQIAEGKLEIEYERYDDQMIKVTLELGMDSLDFRALFDEGDYIRDQGDEFIRYTIGGTYVYFNNNDDNNGLASIVYPGTVYGFEPTITKKQDVVSVMGEGVKSGPVPEKAASMFLYGSTDYTYNVYKSGNNCIAFFFTPEGILSLTAINQDGYWIY